MMNKFKQLFNQNPKKKDFSSFFNHASPEEKRRVLEEVVRKANQDQRELAEEYKLIHRS